MTIGDIIHNKRKQLGLTLEEVGNAVGVSKSTVRKWETGYIANIKRDKISNLAKILQINPVVLIQGEEPICTTDNNKVDKFQLTLHEEKVIIAYRSKPEMQPAVDKLLGIDAEESTEIIKIAARNGSFTETTITNGDIEKINNLPDVDDI